MSTNLTDPIFNNEAAARAHFETIRWPDGRICPHCGVVDNSHLMQGKSTRPGLYKCRDCRKPFSATIGTIYERSHIPLHKWLLATHLMVSSKGITRISYSACSPLYARMVRLPVSARRWR